MLSLPLSPSPLVAILAWRSKPFSFDLAVFKQVIVDMASEAHYNEKIVEDIEAIHSMVETAYNDIHGSYVADHQEGAFEDLAIWLDDARQDLEEWIHDFGQLIDSGDCYVIDQTGDYDDPDADRDEITEEWLELAEETICAIETLGGE